MDGTNLLSSKHYLLLEIHHLETTLKYFFEAGILAKDSYEYLLATIKMIRSYIQTQSVIKTGERKRENMWNEYKSPICKRRKRQPLFKFRQLPLPFPVTVVGLTESLRELQPLKQGYSGPKFPHKIPSGTHWDNIIIKFLTDEQVEIWVKKLKHTTDFREMGMIGKGDKPNQQWIFLKVLAQYQGEITIRDVEAKERYKKQKSLLSDSLKNYFSIEYDPFYPYHGSPEKSGNSYRIKLLLLPPASHDNSKKPHTPAEEADTLGIKEFLAEEAPEIME